MELQWWHAQITLCFTVCMMQPKIQLTTSQTSLVHNPRRRRRKHNCDYLVIPHSLNLWSAGAPEYGGVELNPPLAGSRRFLPRVARLYKLTNRSLTVDKRTRGAAGALAQHRVRASRRQSTGAKWGSGVGAASRRELELAGRWNGFSCTISRRASRTMTARRSSTSRRDGDALRRKTSQKHGEDRADF